MFLADDDVVYDFSDLSACSLLSLKIFTAGLNKLPVLGTRRFESLTRFSLSLEPISSVLRLVKRLPKLCPNLVELDLARAAFRGKADATYLPILVPILTKMPHLRILSIPVPALCVPFELLSPLAPRLTQLRLHESGVRLLPADIQFLRHFSQLTQLKIRVLNEPRHALSIILDPLVDALSQLPKLTLFISEGYGDLQFIVRKQLPHLSSPDLA